MKKYSINETYIALDQQRIFDIEKPFINDTISVFVKFYLFVYILKMSNKEQL